MFNSTKTLNTHSHNITSAKKIKHWEVKKNKKISNITIKTCDVYLHANHSSPA